jgi:hypothetical protein
MTAVLRGGLVKSEVRKASAKKESYFVLKCL